MGKILITGAAGFIGSHYLDFLAENRSELHGDVVVIDLLTYSGLRANIQKHIDSQFITFHKGDITNYSFIESVFTLEKIDSVINFAAESHVDRSINNPLPFINTNILGTVTLLDAFKKYSSGRFLQVSTDEVYGSIDKGSWSEKEPLQPSSPYAASKASGDLIAGSYFKTFGIDICITRCSNNYGSRQFPEKVIPLFVTNLIEKKRIPLYGDGTNVRDWIHVRDHCRAINLVFENGKSGEIYNIGEGKELSNRDLSHRILNKFGKDSSWIEAVKDRKGHDFRYSVNSEKIRRELGFASQTSFEEGLEETIEWYVQNENWWRPLKGSNPQK